MEQLKVILEELKKMTSGMNLIASSDMILDCATRIYISEKIREERQTRTEKPFEKKQAMASDKQVWTLINKCNVPESEAMNMSSSEAFQIISKRFGSR